MASRPAFLQLINTQHIHDAGRVTDHLDDPAAVARLAARWGLPSGIGPAELETLRSLRAVLRDAVGELQESGSLGSEALGALNAVLEADAPRASLRRGEDGSFLLEESWAAPAARVAASFARYLCEDDPRRLKLCDNPHCRWAFRDDSKNRSRRWCSSEACGNVAKLRAFRARKRTAG